MFTPLLSAACESHFLIGLTVFLLVHQNCYWKHMPRQGTKKLLQAKLRGAHGLQLTKGKICSFFFFL